MVNICDLRFVGVHHTFVSEAARYRGWKWHMKLSRTEIRRAYPMSFDQDSTLLDELVKASSGVKATKHQILVREDDTAQAVYAVVSGALTLWKQRVDGRNQVTGFLFGGELLGATTQSRFLASARAASDCVLARLERHALADLSDRFPSFRHALYGRLQNDFSSAQDQLVILGLLSAQERLATFLLQLDRRQRARGWAREVPVWLPMRRTDLASFLGLELPTLSRTFAKLVASGAIGATSRTDVSIRDRRRLEALSPVYPEAA